MKSPQAMLQFLRKRRQDATEKLAGNGDFGVAVCEVLDELIRRTQVIADEYPASSKMSLRDILEMPAVVGAMQAILETVAALSDVASECADATAARRDPVLKFVARVKAEGFEVANDWTLTDPALSRTPTPTTPHCLCSVKPKRSPAQNKPPHTTSAFCAWPPHSKTPRSNTPRESAASSARYSMADETMAVRGLPADPSHTATPAPHVELTWTES
ncbi:Uncharacterised protein [Mycobacteroides abscessus]|nr:Uncharacterised protein [Mycobacteroides abscessus]